MPGQNENKSPAGFWIRLGASFIDFIIITTIAGFISFAVILVINLLGLSDLEALLLDISSNLRGHKASDQTLELVEGSEEANDAIYGALSVLLCILLWAINNILLTASSLKGTIGKYLLGIAVLDRSGNQIGLLRAVIRFFATFLSWVTISLGFILAVTNRKKKALHDFLSGTEVRVVR